MAEFNPEVRQVQPERVFKPYPAEISQPASPKAAEELFGGIGQTLHQGVKDAVQLEDLQITKEAHAKVDPLQEKSISDLDTMLTTVKGTAAAARAGVSQDIAEGGGGAGETPQQPQQPTQFPSLMDPASKTATLPIAVKNSERDLSLLEAARAKGTISETAKNMQEWSMLKDLRARYPGFREEVDAAMHKATGHDIANHTIQGLITDINSYITNKNAEQDKAIAMLTREANIGVQRRGPGGQILGVDWAVQQVKAGRMDMAGAIRFIAPDMAITHRATLIQAERHTMEAGKAIDQNDIEKEMDGEFPRQLQADVDKHHQMSGQSWVDIGTGDKQFKNPDEAGMALAQFRDKEYQRFMATLQHRTSPDGRSYYQILGSEGADKLANRHLKYLDNQMSLIYDDKHGSLGANERNIKFTQAESTKDMYDNPVIGSMARVAHAAKNVSPFMEDVAKEGLKASGIDNKMKTYIDGIQKAAVKQPTINGDPESGIKATGKPFTMLDAFEDARKHGVTSKTYDSIIRFSGELTNPKANDEEKRNIAEYAFNPANIKLFPQIQGFDKQMDYYGYMTSDAMAREAKKLGGKYWENYKQLTLGAFNVMFDNHVKELDRIASGDERIQFKYSDKDHSWSVIPFSPMEQTPESRRMGAYSGPLQPIETLKAEEVANNVSKGLRSVARVLKAEGHTEDEVETILRQTFRRMGVTVNTEDPSGKMLRSLELSKAQEELKAKMKPGQY